MTAPDLAHLDRLVGRPLRAPRRPIDLEALDRRFEELAKQPQPDRRNPLVNLAPHNRPAIAEGLRRFADLLDATVDAELPTPWHGGHAGILLPFQGERAERRLRDFAHVAGLELEPVDDDELAAVVRFRTTLVGLKLTLSADRPPPVEVADVPALVPEAESDEIPPEELDPSDVAELALLVLERHRAGTLTDEEAVELGLGFFDLDTGAEPVFELDALGRAVVRRVLELLDGHDVVIVDTFLGRHAEGSA